jgi:hypothetical protein
VPGLLGELFQFLNTENPNADPIFLAAYTLWRICWIHPFEDGNGRTARALSYVILSRRLGLELPGDRPIPTRLKHAPRAFTRALEAADDAWKGEVIDVSKLQKLIAFHLEGQLENRPPELPPVEDDDLG